MKYDTASVLVALIGLTSAAPTSLVSREVPQEHSHNRFLNSVRTSLNLNNPQKIQDPVFGLLGDKAAQGGAGQITNLACLHQATADQAFTNAKKKGDIKAMSDALIFAALERNTQGIGTKSADCTDKAANPEIGAIKQHQDPASAGAAAANKAVVLELAKQLKSIGANPQDALLSGTFKPGNKNDGSGKGNTCDTIDDKEGCIFSQNLLVQDATPEEIDAAVGGGGGGAVGGGAGGKKDEPASCESIVPPKKTTAPKPNNGAAAGAAASGTNVQTFTGTLGGPAPPVISSAGDRPFTVNGNTFVNIGAALARSCDIQNNACANAINSKKLAGSLSDCAAQQQACSAAKKTRRQNALDFGSCSNPAVKFAVGLDGRKESSFQAVNQKDFNHGSALNIGVISSFICGQLSSKCKASAATVTACKKAQAAAGKVRGKASANAFNAALGVSA